MSAGFFVAAGMVTLAALVFAMTHAPEQGTAPPGAIAIPGPDDPDEHVTSGD